ncbi:hypothetical protein VP01_75g1 [Puccinia sorghi]|uniref:Uncharacterized protein n=1 Tax=Puccinia sorghi TaxID=27349 RepID=A0A0L6UBW6_9BASI|nr:hypothetical protein VP01_75g1 [Puccinia sorghi]
MLHEFLFNPDPSGSPKHSKFPSQDSPCYLFHSTSQAKPPGFLPLYCSQCVKETTSSSTGKIISGCWVHPTTRRRHWSQEFSPLKDLSKLKLALPSTPPPLENQETTDSEPKSKEVLNETESISKLEFSFIPTILICLTPILPLSHRIHILLHCVAQRSMRSYLKIRIAIQILSEILYEPEDVPVTYIYCKSKKAQACVESLFKLKHDPLIPQYQPMSHASIPCPTVFVPFIPRLVYHTQKFFPGGRQFNQRLKKITDIQQSNAWRGFSIKAKQALSGNELRVTFSLYIDWFNPFSNEISGRHALI